jgi:hypothetical protein
MAYVRFAVWSAVGLIVYAAYSMHRAEARDQRADPGCVQWIRHRKTDRHAGEHVHIHERRQETNRRAWSGLGSDRRTDACTEQWTDGRIGAAGNGINSLPGAPVVVIVGLKCVVCGQVWAARAEAGADCEW